MTIYFENLIVEFYIFYVLKIHVKFHILYVLKTYIKFHVNEMLFTIWSINLFFMYNFRLQKSKFNYLIDHDRAIDFFFLEILQLWKIYKENVIQW